MTRAEFDAAVTRVKAIADAIERLPTIDTARALATAGALVEARDALAYAAQVVQAASESARAFMRITDETPNIVATWHCYLCGCGGTGSNHYPTNCSVGRLDALLGLP